LIDVNSRKYKLGAVGFLSKGVNLYDEDGVNDEVPIDKKPSLEEGFGVEKDVGRQ
jgi:hypothetical protein